MKIDNRTDIDIVDDIRICQKVIDYYTKYIKQLDQELIEYQHKYGEKFHEPERQNDEEN